MLRFLFKISFTVVLIGLLFKAVGWENLLNGFRHARIDWLVIMYGVSMIGRTVEALQMQKILAKAGYSLEVTRIFLANSLSSLYALILPGDMIASAAKWANLSSATNNKSVVINAIVYNRLVILVPPLIIGAAALAWENPFPESFLEEGVTLLALAGIVAVICLFHPKYGATTDRLVRKLFSPLPHKIKSHIETVLDALQPFRRFRLRDHISIYTIGILSMIMNFVVFACAVKAVGLKIPFLTQAWTMALLLASRQVPITLSNLGIREGILMAVLSNYGVDLEVSFTLGLIIFSYQIVVAFIGLLYQISLSLGLSESKLESRKYNSFRSNQVFTSEK